ncbi:uncharacterized protein [Littorina saxatilis]
MTVRVEVEPDFMGTIYAQDHEDSCQFTNTSQDPTIYIYEFFHLNSSSYGECGQTFTTAGNNSREFSATTIVQFNPSVLVASDLSHTSSCAFNNDISVRTQLGNINGSGINLAQSESSAEGRFSEFYRFGVSALDPEGNGAELSGSEEVTVGTRLKLFAMVLHNSIFSRMLLTNCVASSRANQTDEDYVSLQLLDHSGCRATDSVVERLQLDGPLYTFDLQNVSHHSYLTLTSFMFVKGRTGNSNQLVFSCDVMLCPSDNTDPCAYNCSSPASNATRQSADAEREERVTTTPAHPVTSAPPVTTAHPANVVGSGGRRRREAAEGIETVTVHRSVHVTSRQLNKEDSVAAQPAADLAQCLKNHTMQSIMVALGVLLIALLMVVVTLVVLFCRRRRCCHCGDEGKRVDDGLSMRSSVQKLGPGHLTKYRG